MDYQLQEGSITLPEGFQDRTVNMFILGNSIPAPLNITVSRDNLLSGEDLGAYIERQVKLIASKLRGYTILARSLHNFRPASPRPVFRLMVITSKTVDLFINARRHSRLRLGAFWFSPLPAKPTSAASRTTVG